MAEWFVEGYVTNPVTVAVQADTAEEARALGEEMLSKGFGVEASPVMSPEVVVYTHDWSVYEFDSELF